MADDINNKGLANDRQVPTPNNQNIWTPLRTDRYGSQFVQGLPGERHAMANMGRYFVAHNAINDASTTLAGHAAPVLADIDATMTKPFVFIRVPSGVTNRIFLDFIEIEVVTAGASGTNALWAAQLDTGTTRLSSGGTALTIVNPNMADATASALSATSALLAGAPVVGAESANSRDLGFGVLRPSIEIAGDKKLFVFGANPGYGGAQSDTAATAIRSSCQVMPPVILGATDQFLLGIAAASQASAGVYKLRMAWWEV